MTSLRVRLIVLAVALLFLLFIALQVRWRRLRARYLVLWAAICILVIPIVIIPAVANGISSALGIYYPPATLFLIAIIVLFAINFQFSREITRLEERTRILAEELALQRVTEGKPFSDADDVAEEPAAPAVVRGGR